MPKKGAPPPPPPRALAKAALALAAIGLACLAGEALCRLSARRTVAALRFTESDLYYYYDPAGYRRHIPGKTGYERMWNNQGKAEFRINSLGFRGEEISLDKPKGTFRILFLGDSITLGGRLPQEETFVARVGRALASEAAPRYEVINAGVGDVGLIEETETLETAGMRVQPDLVVLCWYLNDARPPIGFPEEVVYRHWLVRWFNRQAWLRRSYLAGLVYDAVRKRLLERELSAEGRSRRFDWIGPYNEGRWARDPAAFSVLLEAARFDWGDAWNDKSMRWMEDRIRRLRDFAKGRGVRFALVAMPEHAQVYADIDPGLSAKPQRDLSSFALANGIPFLDLLPVLTPRRGESLFYDNCHYTPHGNSIVADALLEFLKGSGELRG